MLTRLKCRNWKMLPWSKHLGDLVNKSKNNLSDIIQYFNRCQFSQKSLLSTQQLLSVEAQHFRALASHLKRDISLRLETAKEALNLVPHKSNLHRHIYSTRQSRGSSTQIAVEVDGWGDGCCSWFDFAKSPLCRITVADLDSFLLPLDGAT